MPPADEGPISAPFHSSDYFKGVALVFAATVFWSLSGIFVRSMATTDGMQIAIYRAFFATLTLFAVLALRYRTSVFQRFRAMAGLGTILCGGFFAAVRGYPGAPAAGRTHDFPGLAGGLDRTGRRLHHHAGRTRRRQLAGDIDGAGRRLLFCRAVGLAALVPQRGHGSGICLGAA